MALEELLPENIDCIYAAKLMAPYLEIASPLLPKPSKADMAKQAVYGALWKCLQGAGSVYCVLEDSLYVLTHPKYWKQEREERKQLRKEREERKRMGLKSRDEEMAQSLIDAHDADEKELEQKLTEAGALMPQGRGHLMLRIVQAYFCPAAYSMPTKTAMKLQKGCAASLLK